MQVWKNKRVLVTGHTGFKGAWLALWLHQLGAEVHGFSLNEDPSPGAYFALGVRELLKSEKISDLFDFESYADYHAKVKPDFVMHLAAQALVRESYREPLKTLQSNVMGTAHVLETLRVQGQKCAALMVTSDKCYENDESLHDYQETDRMGGHDVYSMSKGVCELIVSSYRRSFFDERVSHSVPIKVATARAGNVIGGGDFAKDRIVPDCVRALCSGKKIMVRNPTATRPWQHVLEPISGYITLGEKLLGSDATDFCEGWNFGPETGHPLSVGEFVEIFIKGWGAGAWEHERDLSSPHEAKNLSLNISKAKMKLGFKPRWDNRRAILETVEWYRKFESSSKQEGILLQFSLSQIEKFSKT